MAIEASSAGVVSDGTVSDVILFVLCQHPIAVPNRCTYPPFDALSWNSSAMTFCGATSLKENCRDRYQLRTCAPSGPYRCIATFDLGQ